MADIPPIHEAARALNGSEASILLVDDNPKNLLALESILEAPGYRLVRAQTAESALMAVMEEEYAAIVLDVKMPDMSGIELARLIKQRKKSQHIPILFLTAHYRENEHAVLGYDVGAVDYLTKPVHPGVLRSKIGVFVDLFRKTRALAEMNAELEAKNLALELQAEERDRRIRAEAGQAEAEAANAAKDRFLAMLSHELRTPLSPVLHAAALLDEQSDCSPETKKTLEIIRRNVQLEARLIDDLLDIARIRNGKLQLHFQSSDAHDLLRHALEICRPDIERHALKIETRFDAHTSRLFADPARIQQIFWNLVNNAVKFTPEGGSVTISTSNDGETLRVEVRDTGVGIEPGKLLKIFDAFEQVEPGGPGGLGLGLAICKALTEFHKGAITAESDGSGCGAAFAVTLPTSDRSAAAGEQETPSPPAATPVPLRLLVVEDHGDTADTLRRLLARRGHQVTCAEDVAGALAVGKAMLFDVLVTDIGLPDGSGIDLFTSLKNLPGNGRMRGIALSGFGTDEDLARSKAAGFSNHITKPVDFPALENCLSQIGQSLRHSVADMAACPPG